MKTRRRQSERVPRTAARHRVGMVWTALGLAAVAAVAAPVEEAQVRTALETWVRHVTADARPDATIVQLAPHVVDGVTVAYTAHFAGGGYCIGGADDRLLPVYLYNARGTWDAQDPGNRAVLHEIAQRYALFVQAEQARDPVLVEYGPGLAERAAQWRDLAAGKLPPSLFNGERADPPSLVLPMYDYWHQGSPYNDSCPVLTPGSDEHAVVGCVATAMSEILYYWQWPVTGTGTGSTTYSFRHSTDWISTPLVDDPQVPANWGGGNRLRYNATAHALEMRGWWDGTLYNGARENWVTPGADPTPEYLAALEDLWNRLTQDDTICNADYAGTTYDWSRIHAEHTDPADADDAAVAWLCYTVGVACDMGYGLWSSSSHTYWASLAYSDHFRFDPDAINETRDVAKMLTEIRWLRPVQMGGHSETGGHSWVACGYNTTVSPPQFLMNKGWGGGPNDWYSVDQFFPNGQDNVIYIAPLDVVRFVGGGFGGDGSPSHPYVNLTTALGDVPDGTTLIMKAGTAHTVTSGAATIAQPLVLKGHQVTISRE